MYGDAIVLSLILTFQNPLLPFLKSEEKVLDIYPSTKACVEDLTARISEQSGLFKKFTGIRTDASYKKHCEVGQVKFSD